MGGFVYLPDEIMLTSIFSMKILIDLFVKTTPISIWSYMYKYRVIRKYAKIKTSRNMLETV